MRKSFITLCAIVLTSLLTCACQKEQEDISSSPIIQPPITFQACLPEPDGGATKAGFGVPKALTCPVLWESTDVAAVTVGYGAKPVSAGITPSDNARVGTFTATLGAPTSGSFTVQAVVPEWALVSYNTSAQDITLNIPASQTPSATGPDPKAIQLVASQELDAVPSADTPVELPFHHATAYGCISLTNLPTNAETHSIDLIFSVPVSGKWNYKPSDGSMTADVSANIITLHTSSASNVFFGCAPADLQGQTLKVRVNTSAGIWEKIVTISDDRQFKVGIVANFSVNMASAGKKTSIKLLSIGNSLARDSIEYLWDVLQSAGYPNSKLGELYIGGSSLEDHVNNYKNSTKKYEYRSNSSGSWNTKSSQASPTWIKSDDWEYIVIHQGATSSGAASTYIPFLWNLIDIIRMERPKAKLLFFHPWPPCNGYNGTWAWRFEELYDGDEMICYLATSSVTKEVVCPTRAFGDVIQGGTAVMNYRAWQEDDISRDKIHLSYRVGRLLAALAWCRGITDHSVTNNNYTPVSYSYSDDELYMIKQAVEKAYELPYEITPGFLPPEETNEGFIWEYQ